MWTTLLKSGTGTLLSAATPTLQSLAAATSLPGMFTAVAQKGMSHGLSYALRLLFKLATFMFVGLFVMRCSYNFRAIYEEEVAATNISCARHHKCLLLPEILISQPAHREPCVKDKVACSRIPFDRALERVTDILPAWADLVAGVKEQFLLVLVVCFALRSLADMLVPPTVTTLSEKRQKKLAKYADKQHAAMEHAAGATDF